MKNKTGADSPGFTWRCSGQPWDLEKWKALPPPPLPVPPPAAASPPPTTTNEDFGSEKGNSEAVFGPDPLFRPVVYGNKV